MTRQFIRPDLPEGDPFPVAHGFCRAKMDQNESPVDLPEPLKKELLDRLASKVWTRYPQPQEYQRIKMEFADSLGVASDRLALTSGCDGAIQGIHFLAGGSGRKGLCFLPTYPMLHHAAWLSGTAMTLYPVGAEYRVQTDAMPGKHLILLANPNNPTGTLTDDGIIEEALATDAMVFVDEAYYDFSGKTWIDRLHAFPNLAIGRSCSKSMLAGIRLGALMAHPTVIRAYESLVTAPYHLSHLQLVTAALYSDIQPFVKAMSREIIHERHRLETAMTDMGIQCYPSHANFILFKIFRPDTVFQTLLKNGIRLRNMTSIPGLQSHLRVTVGTPEENNLFLEGLRTAITDGQL